MMSLAPILADASPTGPLPAVLFYMFAGVTVAASLSVALSRNIVRAAVGLLFALAGMSGLYLLLHAEFIAAVQLVVYVGGTLILIVFGVMLTSKSPNTTYAPKRLEVAWAALVTALVAAPLMAIMVATEFPRATAKAVPSTAAQAIGAVGDAYPMKSLGQALLEPTGYLVPFELISVLLLAVMIGAAYLAKGRRPREGDNP